MRFILGAAIAVLGIVLVIFGLDAHDSVSSRISKLFTGSPTDKTIWLLVGGVVAFVVGLSVALVPHRGERV